VATIPASAIVQVLPNVISAGGSALVLNGIMLTQSYRVPIGTVQSFATAASVGAFFGLTSQEYLKAQIYFGGFTGSTQLPGSLLIAQYPQTSVAAWLRSGPISGLSIAQIQALTGSINITVDGYPRTAASVNLSSATSYTAAATLIQTALNTTEPTEAVMTGAIAPVTSSFTASIAEDVMTVTGTVTGTLAIGTIITGTGVTAGTQVLAQLSGVAGAAGTYAVSIIQAVVSTAISGSCGILTVSAVTSGTVSVGQTVTGTGVTAGTVVTQLGTGVGLTGTYYVSPTQTASSTTLTFTATNITVTYDSVSGSLFFTSGITGAASTIAYATGTLSASLNLTSATGAVLSQGSIAQSPSTFMTGLIAVTQNWASFFTVFDPDDGNGNVQKQAFAAWTSLQNNRYVYIAWDSDVTPTASNAATASLGYICGPNGLNYYGVCPIYDPSNVGIAAFVAGSIASVNFSAVNGRITFAFRSQAGLPATVTNQQVAANLIANNYNFYGAYATANQSWIFFYNGQATGNFLWLDSLINQIWLNNQFQLALILMLQNINSIPYNAAGYAIMQAALLTTINQALTFGAIRAGVPLSSSQAIQVNTAAGYRIDDVLSQRGWYVQVLAATPQVRQARGTPPFNFWYVDGQSVQQITLNSIELV